MRNDDTPALVGEINAKVRSSVEKGRRRKRSTETDTPEFNAMLAAFCHEYPRKRDGTEVAREPLRKALGRASFETIMAGLATYQFGDNPQFWHMPSSWLNQSRWTHRPDTAPPTMIVPKPQTDLARLSESLFEDTPTINEKGMPI